MHVPPPAAILRHPERHSPIVVGRARANAEDLQLRIADAITKFAGSMPSSTCTPWSSPRGCSSSSSPGRRSRSIVSLEAIFLSTFVMIGQNRQSTFQQAKADHDFIAEEQELPTTRISRKRSIR